MNFLVSAGPTREYLDSVRFISSASSGRMGFAVARAARTRGHQVVLVSGPTALELPAGLETVTVTSTVEMLAALKARFEWADCLVMAAAPADYRPETRRPGKISKGTGTLLLKLTPNPDILMELNRHRSHQVVIGFAMEAADVQANAREKMRRKRMDAVVANGPAAFAARTLTATVLLRDGGVLTFDGVEKDFLGLELVKLAEGLRTGSAETPGGACA